MFPPVVVVVVVVVVVASDDIDFVIILSAIIMPTTTNADTVELYIRNISVSVVVDVDVVAIRISRDDHRDVVVPDRWRLERGGTFPRG